jgi:hypothetical protein
MITFLPASFLKGMPYKVVDGIVWHKVPYYDYYAINPTDVAVQALRGSDVAYKWLVKDIKEDGSLLHRYYDIYYKILPPWTSSVTQALASTAFLMHGDTDLALRALSLMMKYHYTDGVIFEKSNDIILNGWLYGYIALLDYKNNTNDSVFDNEINRIESVLKKLLPHFIMKNNWSRYDLKTGIPATPFYHNIHIHQLSYLNRYNLSWKMEQAQYPKFKRMLYVTKKNNIKMLLTYYRYKRWKNG